MKDLVQCRKLEAKFRQLAVSDPARRFLWLAEAEKWEREAEAEIASQFEARNAVRTTVAIEPITTKSNARSGNEDGINFFTSGNPADTDNKIDCPREREHCE